MWDRRFIGRRAGKRSWGLEAAAEEVLESEDVAVRTALTSDIIAACRAGRFAGVLDAPAWLRA